MQARLGTMDPLFDAKELPSPLDGEVKLKYLAETYRSHELQSQISTVTSAIPLRGP
jgi:protein transport protein SEC24